MGRKPFDTAAMTMAGLNLIQQGLSIYDRDLKLVACNRPFREMFDLDSALVRPGADFEGTIRFLVERGEYGEIDDIEEAIRVRVEQAKTFTPHYMERKRANGHWISVEGSPLPQGGWVTVYTDITRAKQQEELLRARSEELSDKVLTYAEQLATANRKLAATVTALEEAKHQLTETEARTRQTTEMMPAHIAHVGLDRYYTFSNRKLSSVMPGRPSNIVGLHIADALGKDIYAAIRPHLEEAYSGTPSVFEFFDESSSRRIRAAFTPAQDTDGGDDGVYILSMDITRETQARTALQQTRRREMAAQLTSGMAHDFSNLLTIILGSQSRLQKMDLPADAKRQIEATLSAAHRGGSLLNRIADITGAREWNPVPADVGLMLDDLQILAAPALPANFSLNISNLLHDNRLMLDTGMLQDSLLNLILNARDACGKSGQISLTVAPVQNLWAEFILDDTGPGFSDTALEHALEPFFTTKGGEGSGLGLSMVYDMTKLAGGRIGVSNTETGGRVVIRLPLQPAPPPLEPGLVLLVEDSPDLRETVRSMLTALGNTVIEAETVDEALALLDGLPDIGRILSDITLAGEKTGLDLLDALPSGHPPLSLMTSLPPDHPICQIASTRAPLLRKPFTQSQLTTFLQQEALPE
ncbi:hybrid sensor histidine kinase/response regulator [Thalassovita mangrovi]|uniref:histidine kinase n=1 Tax=Thalassovita mangrovi TaxID=2692236 RepID=A0A6L8LMA0_9RHOB|nr:PAS-domain containing protein [Thalassovita mangrovi]MYM55670.1 PAS domain-containing protein [Thalassovita mangrovi]